MALSNKYAWKYNRELDNKLGCARSLSVNPHIRARNLRPTIRRTPEKVSRSYDMGKRANFLPREAVRLHHVPRGESRCANCSCILSYLLRQCKATSLGRISGTRVPWLCLCLLTGRQPWIAKCTQNKHNHTVQHTPVSAYSVRLG